MSKKQAGQKQDQKQDQEPTAQELEEIKALKREYKRKWYENNKEKQKAANERYWRKKLQAIKAEADKREAAE